MASLASQAFGAQVGVVVVIPSQKLRRYDFNNHRLQIRAVVNKRDEFADKSSPRSMVDSNLRVLRNRVNEIQVKERLERCLLQVEVDNRHHNQRPAGWSYLPAATTAATICEYKKKKKKSLELSEVALMVSTTFGGTLLTGTLSLYLLSLFLHLNQ